MGCCRVVGRLRPVFRGMPVASSVECHRGIRSIYRSPVAYSNRGSSRIAEGGSGPQGRMLMPATTAVAYAFLKAGRICGTPAGQIRSGPRSNYPNSLYEPCAGPGCRLRRFRTLAGLRRHGRLSRSGRFCRGGYSRRVRSIEPPEVRHLWSRRVEHYHRDNAQGSVPTPMTGCFSDSASQAC